MTRPVAPRPAPAAPPPGAGLDAWAARSRSLLSTSTPWTTGGRVRAACGLVVRVTGLELSLGEAVLLDPGAGRPTCRGEVVGFEDRDALVMPEGRLEGIGTRTAVFPLAGGAGVPCGEAVLGRVLDARGELIDGGPPLPLSCPRRPLRAEAPRAVERRPVDQRLDLGVRVLDAALTFAEGSRMGLFAAAGVGKSTLLGMIARRARADAIVVCLVGERGREVRELLEGLRDAQGCPLVFVVSTAADPPLARARAPLAATAIAEGLRDEGKHVLLLMDSLTRYAQALREIGLARGEAPAARGFPPSALAALAPLLERAGTSSRGAITGLYTVLVEGDDPDEPVADTARSLLDGHVELSRALARSGVYPAVDPAASSSRLMDRVVPPDQLERAREFKALWSAYDEKQDLIAVGAYRPGSDPHLDRAVRLRPRLEAFVRQFPGDLSAGDEAADELASILSDDSERMQDREPAEGKGKDGDA